MDAIISLFKTDNIAIILLTIAVIALWTQFLKLGDKIIKLSSEVGELKGKDSAEKSLAVIFGKIDVKLDLILKSKSKPKADLKTKL